LNTVGDAQPMPTRSVCVSENGYRFKMADVFVEKKEDDRRFRIIFVRASIFGNAKKILIDRFFQNKKKILIDRL
jgi:hypothetical protein